MKGFEGRARRGTLLAYDDDATGSIMLLPFAESELAFDYFPLGAQRHELISVCGLTRVWARARP